MVKSLCITASVEILDIYALVGPMDTFDYRHVAKVQGRPVEGLLGLYSFSVDANTIPREQVWQIQLKLSSNAQQITSVDIHDFSVIIDTLPGSGSVGIGGLSLSNTTTRLGDLNMNKSNRGATSTSMDLSDSARSQASNFYTSTRSMSASTRTAATTKVGRGLSTADRDATRSASHVNTGAPGGSAATSLSSSSSALSASSLAPRAHGNKASKLFRSTELSSSAMGRTGGSGGKTGELVLRGGRGEGEREAVVPHTGHDAAVMRQETEAVASVLNAVCEKMVGVMSEKTKLYLAKAGRKTERRVLEKMAKLEERIEKFDNVLEHATLSSREIEKALLALDKNLPSPRKPSPVAVGP